MYESDVSSSGEMKEEDLYDENWEDLVKLYMDAKTPEEKVTTFFNMKLYGIDILDYIYSHDIAIGGGSILAAIHGTETNDIDIYIDDVNIYIDFLNYFSNILKSYGIMYNIIMQTQSPYATSFFMKNNIWLRTRIIVDDFFQIDIILCGIDKFDVIKKF